MYKTKQNIIKDLNQYHNILNFFINYSNTLLKKKHISLIAILSRRNVLKSLIKMELKLLKL